MYPINLSDFLSARLNIIKQDTLAKKQFKTTISMPGPSIPLQAKIKTGTYQCDTSCYPIFKSNLP